LKRSRKAEDKGKHRGRTEMKWRIRRKEERTEAEEHGDVEINVSYFSHLCIRGAGAYKVH
jgi:hypothetical protein